MLAVHLYSHSSLPFLPFHISTIPPSPSAPPPPPPTPSPSPLPPPPPDSDKTNDEIPMQRGETIDKYTERTVETDDYGDSRDIPTNSAVFGHRDNFRPHPEGRCPVRVRLNPSRPSRAGSVWHHTPVPINKGFQTLFTFQISDHSKECSKHKDPTFSLHMYESCAVHGGDGELRTLARTYAHLHG